MLFLSSRISRNDLNFSTFLLFGAIIVPVLGAAFIAGVGIHSGGGSHFFQADHGGLIGDVPVILRATEFTLGAIFHGW